MKVLVKATGDFIHGEFNMRPGDEAVMDSHLAEELKHLVQVVPTSTGEDDGKKMAPPVKNKMMPAADHNKAQDDARRAELAADQMADEGEQGNDDSGEDGEDATSSASPAAPASPKPIAKPSVFGAKATAKKGKR